MSTDHTRRQEHLAKALRENLLRRKAQQRARRADADAGQQDAAPVLSVPAVPPSPDSPSLISGAKPQ